MKSVLFLLALVPSLAFADVKSDLASVDNVLRVCLDGEQGQYQAGMNACAYEAFESSDKILNAVYKDALKVVDAEGAKRLRASQRAWITFRDLNSVALVQNLGGSLERLEINMNLHNTTKARALELDENFGNRENL